MCFTLCLTPPALLERAVIDSEVCVTKSVMPQYAVCRAFAIYLVWLSSLAVLQDGPFEVKETPLEVVSTLPVASIIGGAITPPIVCTSDNTMFLRLLTRAGTQVLPVSPDVVSISSDGKNVLRFGSDRVNDVPNAVTRGFFVNDDRIYLLVSSDSKVERKTAKLRRPDGSIEEQSIAVGKRDFYIASFQRNGAYIRAVRLDISFVPRQFGVFSNGDFLVAGRTDAWPPEPRVAIVSWNGQFSRFIEFEGDVRADRPEFKTPESRDAFSGNLFFTLDLTRIVADGHNLILFRPFTQAPVFVVSPGGAVRPVRLKVARKLTLFNIQPAKTRWVAVYRESLGEGKGIRFHTYSIDPESGKPTETYIYENALGFGLACTDGTAFTFLKAADAGLTIINAMPASATPARNPSM